MARKLLHKAQFTVSAAEVQALLGRDARQAEAPLGVKMRGGGVSAERRLDFYPTPPELTWALLNNWRPESRTVWEPCCGDGALAEVLVQAGLRVISTDITHRGYKGQILTTDFLAEPRRRADCIITNPPFNQALAFLKKAVELEVPEFAFLSKIEFWTVGRNARFFAEHPPALVMPIVGRVDFQRRGNPVMNFQWTVWRRDGRGATEMRVINQASGPVLGAVALEERR